MAALTDVYASGGTLSYKVASAWVVIGLVQNLSLKTSSKTEEVMDYSDATGQVFDEIVMQTDYSIDFSSKAVNAATLQKMFMTTLETGVANPVTDGVAGATTVTKMELGKGSQWVGEMKFESKNNRGEPMTVVLKKVSLNPEGDLALLGQSVAELKFSGRCGKDSNGDIGYILRKEA
jgi:hypothetical protein